VSGIAHARPGDLTFVANAKYLPQLTRTRASAVILGANGAAAPRAASKAARPPCAILRADDPYSAFARAVALFAHARPPDKGVDPLSAVAADASLGVDVSIGPFVTVGAGATVGARTVVYPNAVIGPGVKIGEDCVIHSQVAIRDRALVGNRVILHDGVVVGSDGFGFARQKDGTHLKIPQHADVVIEDDVEIGANSTIDRPAVGETRIRAGTKIDNLVHIAHGVTIGCRTLLAAQVGIAGSTIIGDDVTMAGQSGVTGHVTVGDRALVGAKSAVLQPVGADTFVTGIPAIDHADWRRASVTFARLPLFRKRIAQLERRIATLEEKLARWQKRKKGR